MRRAASAILTGLVAGALIATGVLLAPPGLASADQTTIRMEVRDCEGCTIQPTLLLLDADGTSVQWEGKRVRVRDGQAVLRVPTSKTPGMSFLIDGPNREDINAAPVIVTQFKGYAPGSVVTKAQARKAKRASACWAGTTDAEVSLTVQAMTVVMPKFPDDGTGTTRVATGWFVPTQKAPGGFEPTFGAPLATQEGAWPCNAG